MIELGKRQTLEIVREKEFGVYLAEKQGDEASVLLPHRQVPDGAEIGSRLQVFIYKDSEDRLIATTAEPRLEVGGLAVLKVREVSRIGAFLDMGLEKDLLLPFKEQNRRLEAGDECLVALYVDKSGRLAATTKVYPYLKSDSPYGKDDWAEARVYEINDRLGVFVAVDDRYFGLIPSREVHSPCQPGEVVRVRVTKAYRQIGEDAGRILEALRQSGGELPFGDRVSPDVIRSRFNLSKNAFKRAIGHLLKEGQIELTPERIRLAASPQKDKGKSEKRREKS